MSSSVLRVFAVVLAIGAMAIGYLGYKASQQPPMPEPAHAEEAPTPKGDPVVFAVHDIPAGRVIAQEDLVTGFVPARPARSYAVSAELIGRKPGIGIASGEMILSSHFPSSSQLALSLRPGERAMAVRVDEVIGAGGFIEPGDRVDVLLYLKADQEIGKDSSAQVVLSQVRVLAFGNMLEAPDEQAADDGRTDLLEKAKTGGTKASGKRKNPEEASGKKSKTAVLAIAEADTSKLMLAESSGKLRLALHGAERPENILETGEAQVISAAFSPLESMDGGRDKHYIEKKELVRSVMAKQEAGQQSSKDKQGAQVIIHRGSSTEILTMGR